jgi:hypothetical protein
MKKIAWLLLLLGNYSVTPAKSRSRKGPHDADNHSTCGKPSQYCCTGFWQTTAAAIFGVRI